MQEEEVRASAAVSAANDAAMEELLLAATLPVYEFHVRGISSLLMNNPASMLAQGQESGVGRKNIPTPEDEARMKVYKMDTGQLYIPSIAFRAALLYAGRGRRISGSRIGASTIMAGAVFNCTTETPLFHPATGEKIEDYVINVTRAVVQKAAVMRARAEIKQWAAPLLLEIDTEIVKVEQIETLLNVAGKISGVGDWRPERKGAHGRFTAELVGAVR